MCDTENKGIGRLFQFLPSSSGSSGQTAQGRLHPSMFSGIAVKELKRLSCRGPNDLFLLLFESRPPWQLLREIKSQRLEKCNRILCRE